MYHALALVLTGLLFDLPEVVADATLNEEIARRCEIVGGSFFILDAILEERNEPDFNKFMDLQMLVLTHGGRERTEADFRDLLSRAGLAITRIVPTPSQFSSIEASKFTD